MGNYLVDKLEYMSELFENEFYRIVNNVSYYENSLKVSSHLIKKFFVQNYNKLFIDFLLSTLLI